MPKFSLFYNNAKLNNYQIPKAKTLRKKPFYLEIADRLGYILGKFLKKIGHFCSNPLVTLAASKVVPFFNLCLSRNVY